MAFRSILIYKVKRRFWSFTPAGKGEYCNEQNLGLARHTKIDLLSSKPDFGCASHLRKTPNTRTIHSNLPKPSLPLSVVTQLQPASQRSRHQMFQTVAGFQDCQLQKVQCPSWQGLDHHRNLLPSNPQLGHMNFHHESSKYRCLLVLGSHTNECAFSGPFHRLLCNHSIHPIFPSCHLKRFTSLQEPCH